MSSYSNYPSPTQARLLASWKASQESTRAEARAKQREWKRQREAARCSSSRETSGQTPTGSPAHSAAPRSVASRKTQPDTDALIEEIATVTVSARSSRRRSPAGSGSSSGHGAAARAESRSERDGSGGETTSRSTRSTSVRSGTAALHPLPNAPRAGRGRRPIDVATLADSVGLRRDQLGGSRAFPHRLHGQEHYAVVVEEE